MWFCQSKRSKAKNENDNKYFIISSLIVNKADISSSSPSSGGQPPALRAPQHPPALFSYHFQAINQSILDGNER